MRLSSMSSALRSSCPNSIAGVRCWPTSASASALNRPCQPHRPRSRRQG